MLCDWLKNLLPLFQPIGSKMKTNHELVHTRFYFEYDWFKGLFAFIVDYTVALVSVLERFSLECLKNHCKPK